MTMIYWIVAYTTQRRKIAYKISDQAILERIDDVKFQSKRQRLNYPKIKEKQYIDSHLSQCLSNNFILRPEFRKTLHSVGKRIYWLLNNQKSKRQNILPKEKQPFWHPIYQRCQIGLNRPCTFLDRHFAFIPTNIRHAVKTALSLHYNSISTIQNKENIGYLAVISIVVR